MMIFYCVQQQRKQQVPMKYSNFYHQHNLIKFYKKHRHVTHKKFTCLFSI